MSDPALDPVSVPPLPAQMSTRPAKIFVLPIASVFASLSPQQQLYAHHLSRAAWSSARILMRQVSPESGHIFDLIMALHKECGGDWVGFAARTGVSPRDMRAWLEFSGAFLMAIGNYQHTGDIKMLPGLPVDALRKMASSSPEALKELEVVAKVMYDPHPVMLGFPADGGLSAYYPLAEEDDFEVPGKRLHYVSRADTDTVARAMAKLGLEPENTRVVKTGPKSFRVLVASVQAGPGTPMPEPAVTEPGRSLGSPSLTPATATTGDSSGTGNSNANGNGDDGGDDVANIDIIYGDHGKDLAAFNSHLREARKHAASPEQQAMLDAHIEAFETGDQRTYRRAQALWVRNQHPAVESSFGFIEPYRDPAGVRGEWQAVITLSHPVEAQRLKAFVSCAEDFLLKLHWTGGIGPMTAMRSNVWEACNLPNYNDIRDEIGSKNIIFANRLAISALDPSRPAPFISPAADAATYARLRSALRFYTTCVHEILGHATGKLLAETAPGVHNFDSDPARRPISPITGGPIRTWYRPGETWTSVFGKVAPSAEECRASLVAYYLADDPDVLATFGYVKDGEVEPEEFTYCLYHYIIQEGISALRCYNQVTGAWGQPHSQGDYCTLRHLLLTVPTLASITPSTTEDGIPTLTVTLDRSKIPEAKRALGDFLTRVHISRCTADVDTLTPFYTDLSRVEGPDAEAWLAAVKALPNYNFKFVQANTVLDEGGQLRVKEYEASDEGIVQSFADRDI